MSFSKCVFAAALVLAVTSLAQAQTVIVRNVPAGEAIEVFINEAKSGSATVDSSGVVRIPVNLRAATGATELDARLFVDVCDKVRRVFIVNRNLQVPAKPDGCERRDILGMFWIRERSTLVVDAGSVIPTLLLRQGRYDPTAGKVRVLAPKGIIVFGGGGLAEFSDVVSTFCGTVSDCSGDSTVLSVTGGADLWLTRWFGVEGSYVKPKKVTVEGVGGPYKFTDTFDAHLITAAAKLAIPVGRARMYGKGGGLFHRATATSVVTVNEQNQTLRLRTEGWGWLAGGGIEIWTGRKFALYGEAAVGKIKGEAVGTGVEGEADDRVLNVVAGFRVKVF